MPPTLDPRVDAYIAQAAPFARPLLEKIRKAFHKGCPSVVETMKWRTPFFEHAGLLLGNMGAYKQHVSLGFWRAQDLEDPEDLLTGVGNMAMAARRVESAKDLPTQKVLVDYVRRAARHNEALAAETPGKGTRKTPARKTAARKKAAARPAPRAPADLTRGLKAAPDAQRFWRTLPPSAKRDYVEWITGAKREATREKRLATTLTWLAEGKRRNWKYESC